MAATTWDCNLRCSYCFLDAPGAGRSRAPMSRSTAVRLIDALAEGFPEATEISVHLYGGEPLTNLAAAEAMLDHAGELGDGRFVWVITTNGAVASPRAIRLLVRGRFQVVLSIDGPAEVCRRTVSGGPTHAGVMEFLRALRAAGVCSIRGSAVVRSGWRLAHATDYLRSLPVDLIKAQAVRCPPGAPHNLSRAEREEYLRDLEAAGHRVIADIEAGQQPQDDRFSARVLQLLTGVRRDRFCGAGTTLFGVHPSGDVYPCVLLDGPAHRLGSIHDPPARWRAAGLRWLAGQGRRAECAACPALDLCGGGCPVMLGVCGAEECDLVRKNCEVAGAIYQHFRADPEPLLLLAGIE